VKKHAATFLLVCMFFGGLALFLYPSVSNFYNQQFNDDLIENYQVNTETLGKTAYDAMLEDARVYNENLFDTIALSEMGLAYGDVLNPYDTGVMGYLEIPKIRVNLAILHEVDESQLQNAVGHIKESSLPVGGKGTHTALAGHRGLPSATLLSNIGQLQLGDVFYIHVLDEVLEYRVDNITVVEPDDTRLLHIEEGEDYATLVTCTPYGINTHRLLVRGRRVLKNTGPEDTYFFIANEVQFIRPILLVPAALAMLAAVFLLLVYMPLRLVNFRKKGKEKNHEVENKNT